MNDVIIGKGKLAGKGTYAGRDFKEGDRVMRWDLKELTQDEFDALSNDDRIFVHSFWGKMYRFSQPACFTNHSANANTLANYEHMCDYATRTIKKGEMITTNATDEIKFELKTFLEAYERAANSRNFDSVEPIIAKKAVFEFTDGRFEGIAAIRRAFESTWDKIRTEKYSIADVKWLKTGYRNAICEYSFRSDGVVKGKRQIYEGRGVNTLKRIDGNWRIVHEKLSKA